MDGQIPDNEFSKEFSEQSFWEKVKKYALKAGKEVITTALTLYYALKDKDTPVWAKGIIISALGYFIFPLDAIPDAIPIAGYTDDCGALAAALGMVVMYIKAEHRKQAEDMWNNWFGNGKEPKSE